MPLDANLLSEQDSEDNIFINLHYQQDPSYQD